jgi:hypothetical protein
MNELVKLDLIKDYSDYKLGGLHIVGSWDLPIVAGHRKPTK